MELQGHKGNYYRISRDIRLTDKKTGQGIIISVGEQIPQAILVDDEYREQLIRQGRIARCARDGQILDAPEFIKLTQQDMQKMIDRPDEMVKDLVKIHFANDSLLALRRLAAIKGLQMPYLKAIDEAIERQ